MSDREETLDKQAPTFRGIGFPWRRGSGGIPRAVEDAEVIADALAQLALTGRNERVMRPGAGCGAADFLFEDNNDRLSSLVRSAVSRSIQLYERRLVLRDVVVGRSSSATNAQRDKDSILIEIRGFVPLSREPVTARLQVGRQQGKVST